MSELDAMMDALNIAERADEVVGWTLHGPLTRFYARRDSGWSGFLIESFLREYHIGIWGRGFMGDTLYFSVKQKQANWAEYLMKRRGIVLASAPINAKNDLYAQRHAPGSVPPRWDQVAPKPSQKKKSRLDELVTFLAGKPPVRK